MSLQDPIADMIVRINNAHRVGHPVVWMDASNLKTALARLLVRLGYLEDHQVVVDDKGIKRRLKVVLRNYQGKPVIEQFVRVSKPSLRVYAKVKHLPRVCGGLGCAIVSTSQGLMTDQEAREARLGGEVLAYIA